MLHRMRSLEIKIMPKPKQKKTKAPSAVSKPFSKHPPKAATAKKPKAVKTAALQVIEPVKYEGDSKRAVKDILSDRVKYLGEIGIELMPDTELSEVGPMLDHFSGYQRHLGFLIGDIIGQSIKLFGEPAMTAMMAQTGRAMSTLRGYVTVANAFPAKQREERLDFTHHQAITRLDPQQRKEMITLALEDKVKPMKAAALKKLVKEKFPKKTKVKSPAPAKLSTKPKVDYVMKPSEVAARVGMLNLAKSLAGMLSDPVEKDGDSWARFAKRLTKEERNEMADALKPAAKLWMQIK